MHPTANSFYGVTTIGTKGQIVIPADARTAMNLQPGDKVIIIGKQHPTKGFGMVCICPIDSVEQFVNDMTNHLHETQAVLQQAKETKKGEQA